MSKRLKILILSFYATGLLLFSVSSMLRHNLTDFWLGFCEGISLVFILLGSAYMIWSLINKKNPYKING